MPLATSPPLARVLAQVVRVQLFGEKALRSKESSPQIAVLKLEPCIRTAEGLLKHRFLLLPHTFLIQEIRAGAQEFAF